MHCGQAVRACPVLSVTHSRVLHGVKVCLLLRVMDHTYRTGRRPSRDLLWLAGLSLESQLPNPKLRPSPSPPLLL